MPAHAELTYRTTNYDILHFTLARSECWGHQSPKWSFLTWIAHYPASRRCQLSAPAGENNINRSTSDPSATDQGPGVVWQGRDGSGVVWQRRDGSGGGLAEMGRLRGGLAETGRLRG